MRATPSWLREVAVVLSVVSLLEIVIFRGFFSGESIPQFDFVSGYNLEAYAWWTDGSFLQPAQWMPYMWGGYPAVSNLQNGSFYLPIGLMALVTPFTLHAAAVLTAIHVAAGAVGAYLFARRWGVTPLVAMIALVGWFFAAGFYSNATHLDIARAYAWIPWLFLVASVKWPWSRWWSVPAASLIVWQAVLGIYPGILVALAYTLLAWVIAQQLMMRPSLRGYLLPLGLAGAAGVAMSLLRFLPALAERGNRPLYSEDLSTFGIVNLGTILFPYEHSAFGGLSVFQSFFLPATIVAALAFALRPHRPILLLAVPVCVALLLGLPLWPWSDLLDEVLPGFSLSRFRASDFKVVILFGLTMIGVHAVQTRIDQGAESGPRRRQFDVILPALVLGTMLAGFASVGIRYGYALEWSLAQWLLLLVSGVILLGISKRSSRPRRWGVRVLVVITAGSGLLSAFGTTGYWSAPRLATETAYLGSTVDSLIAKSFDRAGLPQRPERIAPPAPDRVQDNLKSTYSAVFYDGRSSLYGYLNLRSTEVFEIVRESVDNSASDAVDARAFWSAAGIVLEDTAPGLPDVALTQQCADAGICGEHLTVTPLSYRNSTLVYDVDARAPTSVSINESAYQGWNATLCERVGSDCQPLALSRGEAGEITADMPDGSWTLTLDYRLPHQHASWLIFWVAACCTLVPATFAVWRRILRSKALQVEPLAK